MRNKVLALAVAALAVVALAVPASALAVPRVLYNGSPITLPKTETYNGMIDMAPAAAPLVAEVACHVEAEVEFNSSAVANVTPKFPSCYGWSGVMSSCKIEAGSMMAMEPWELQFFTNNIFELDPVSVEWSFSGPCFLEHQALEGWMGLEPDEAGNLTVLRLEEGDVLQDSHAENWEVFGYLRASGSGHFQVTN